MRTKTLCVAAIGLGVLPACTSYQTLVTPQGSVVQRVSYPQYQAVRTKRQIALTLADQESFRAYYQLHHSWPLSVEGFAAESDANYSLITRLQQQGFAQMDFISRGQDSLRINFIYRTYANVAVDRNVSLHGIGRDITGYFFFVADPVSGISFGQNVSKTSRK